MEPEKATSLAKERLDCRKGNHETKKKEGSSLTEVRQREEDKHGEERIGR